MTASTFMGGLQRLRRVLLQPSPGRATAPPLGGRLYQPGAQVRTIRAQSGVFSVRPFVVTSRTSVPNHLLYVICPHPAKEHRI